MIHHTWHMKIYIIVGKKIRVAEASRIVGKVAIVQSDHGPLEFVKWYFSEEEAKKHVNSKTPN